MNSTLTNKFNPDSHFSEKDLIIVCCLYTLLVIKADSLQFSGGFKYGSYWIMDLLIRMAELLQGEQRLLLPWPPWTTAAHHPFAP